MFFNNLKPLSAFTQILHIKLKPNVSWKPMGR